MAGGMLEELGPSDEERIFTLFKPHSEELTKLVSKAEMLSILSLLVCRL